MQAECAQCPGSGGAGLVGSDTDPQWVRTPEDGSFSSYHVAQSLGVRCPWTAVRGIFPQGSLMPAPVGCRPTWSQPQKGFQFLRRSRKLRFYVNPVHFQMLAANSQFSKTVYGPSRPLAAAGARGSQDGLSAQEPGPTATPRSLCGRRCHGVEMHFRGIFIFLSGTL